LDIKIKFKFSKGEYNLMVLKEFDPKLMRFLYFLATHQKKMDSVKASKELRKGGWSISDRTVRRWFKALNEKREINYFLNLKSENFGVIRTYVLLKNVKAMALSNLIPFVIYNVNGSCLESLERVQLVQYDIPSSKIKEFNEFWKESKKIGLVEDVKIYPHSTAITFYAPFHRTINKNGFIEFEKDYSAPSYFMDFFKKTTKQEIKKGLSKYISEHPIIIPILYSSFGENFSSKRIWSSLKKHSETIWNFVPRKLFRKGKKDGAATKYVQNVLKIIEGNKEELFQQIRVSYKHFYQGNHNTYYLILKIKNIKRLHAFIRELHNKTLQLNYTPLYKKGTCMLYIVTNEKKILEILYDVLPDYIDYNYENKLILQESDPEKNYYGKMDWTRFNPVKKEWVYEHEKYMEDLKKLAKNMRTKR
jgi:repressor of nif and glnA expression